MPLGDFIRNFVQADLDDGAPGRRKGYLAQYSLFDQIPSLREDFSVPEYCSELLPGPDEDDAKARANAAAQGAGSMYDAFGGGLGVDDMAADANGVRTSAWLGPVTTPSPALIVMSHSDFHSDES